MNEEVVGRAPRARCYKCGHDKIASLCHHCQRPMCRKHSPMVFRPEKSQGGTSGGGRAKPAKPISAEFAGFGLDSATAGVYHCDDHDHVVNGIPYRWIALGAAAAALGTLLLAVHLATGLILMLAGLVTAGGALLVHYLRAQNATRPPLPIVPQLGSVELVERLSGYVRLDDAGYASTVDSLAGTMTVTMSTNNAFAGIQAYRKRFTLPPSEPVPFSCGYLMFKGDVGLAFRPGQTSVLPAGTGIALGGDSADDSPLLRPAAQRPHDEPTSVVDYEILDSRTPGGIPLWIVPSLVPTSDRRTLEIDLHWNPLGEEPDNLTLSVFDLIQLEVPASWGHLENSAPGRAEVSLRDDGYREIRWKQVKPSAAAGTSRSLPLTLRFENRITEMPETAVDSDAGPARTGDDSPRTRLTVSGKLEATFDKLLSGVTGVGVYLPGGGAGHRLKATTQTRVAVALDASLRSIRYQEQRAIPDDKASDHPRADEFHGVVPDHSVVAELTNAISYDDYYVKSVVEHLPYLDDARSGVNRVWDISGRRYIGLFPIDFDINLRGEEVGASFGSIGKTTATVTVKGTHAMGVPVGIRPSIEPADDSTAPDTSGDELLIHIENTWESLRDRVTRLLAARAAGAADPRALPSAETTVAPDDVIDGQTWPDDTIRVEATVGPEYGSDVPFAADDPSQRIAELRRQRGVAGEAVVSGRISEETYRSVVAQIDAELAGLECER
ncbi:hypothetical protein O7632_22350 [Solwaraspora sp. WMMD406]|uniref:hypothetical protein n=1 Tax=Solwaraspora sp. WMMD406 TaxID=3016095 RepID=UPI0024166E5D|nr:hypothetical protein [Solwaraspora sp. WMMD406]MDG4766818.1 hypothetical protein [Solwaraspora sp. WMMD406]